MKHSDSIVYNSFVSLSPRMYVLVTIATAFVQIKMTDQNVKNHLLNPPRVKKKMEKIEKRNEKEREITNCNETNFSNASHTCLINSDTRGA